MILGGSMVVLLVLLYFLYDDSLLFPPETHSEAAIGSISVADKDVRRKNNGNFLWLPGNKKDSVYSRDSIFTGKGSQAAIQLKDGSLIEIQENSLVNLNLKGGQMELDLRFGQFTGNGNSTIRVKAGKDEYTIQGKDAKFEVNHAQNGSLDVKVLSGEAEITGKSGKQNLKSNEAVQISKKGAEKSKIDAHIKLLTKDDSILYREADKAPLQLQWEGRGPVSQYQIEISNTENFKKILALQNSAGQEVKVKDSLKEGSYFWRVKGLDQRRNLIATSATHKFYLSYMPSPKITTPEDQAKISATTLDNGSGLQATTQVSWTADDRSINFQWQLSKSADFSENLSDLTLKEKQVSTPALHQGTYYTRVRGFDQEQRPSLWSKPHSFHFEIKAEEKPPAPRLAEKRIRFKIPKPEERTPATAMAPQVAWSTVEVAKDYRWEIARNARFVGAQNATTENTKVSWSQYKPGKHYFRVFARTGLGQSSEASETGVLEVFTEAPVLNAMPTLLVKSDDIRAQAPAKDGRAEWSPVPDAKNYLVQVDKSADFENPVQIEVADSSGPLNLPEPGKYFVRVKALNDSNQDMSEFSNVQSIEYIFKRTLKSPELIEPYDKTTVFLQKDTAPLIWLEWASVPDAVKYVLEIANKEDFSDVILTKELSATRFLVKEKIPYGNVYWRVKAVPQDENLSSDWATRRFLFYHQRNGGF